LRRPPADDGAGLVDLLNQFATLAMFNAISSSAASALGVGFKRFA